MIAVAYSFYAQAHKGKMEEAEFDRLLVQASAFLDRVSFGRITDALPEDVLERVRLACCALVDAMLLNEKGGGIASETNDGISINYVAGVSKAKTDEERLLGACRLHLAGTGLLYRGVL